MTLKRMALPALTLLGLAALTAWAFRPETLRVDLATASVGPMRITVEAEGVTRVRAPYLVTAPIAGTLARVSVEVGDAVERGSAVLAEIRPAEPALLDARSRAQAEAAVTEAEAAVQAASANLARTEASLAFARSDHARNTELAARGTVSSRALEASAQTLDTAGASRDAARADLDLARATLARAEAQLLAPDTSGSTAGDCCLRLSAPVSGTVLTIADESARLVAAGEELMRLGDLDDLEIEVDLLSADAVKLAVGAPATIERWGGAPLAATLRRIEPAAFTRTSALGIEEQRVRLKLDLDAPDGAAAGLGDQFRVYAKITVWEGAEVLQIPQSALFRADDGWAVFQVTEGRAHQVRVELGQRNAETAQILSGLAPGDRVVAYPGNRIAEGSRVAAPD
ncbi:MAG: HlyD family efflux transporter periplasmic adaptor subunit [Paracoccaceae bacterium]